MSDTAENPTVPPLVQASRNFLKVIKDNAPIPKGAIYDSIRDGMLDKKGNDMRGLGVTLERLAEFIDQHQELAAIPANAALLERLRAKDGKNIADMITNIAMGDLTELELLKDALHVGGEDVFSKILLAINNIARDKKLQIADNSQGFMGDDSRPRPRNPADDKREQREDKGTWRESLHADDRPAPSNEDVRKGAGDYDQQDRTNEQDIKKSAQDGPQEFTPGKQDKNEFERMEDAGFGDRGYIMQEHAQRLEIRAYQQLASGLAITFDKMMEPILQVRTQEAPAPSRRARG